MSPPLFFSNILEFCAVSPSHLILKHLISSAVSLAQVVSPSVALPAELVQFMYGMFINVINHAKTYGSATTTYTTGQVRWELKGFELTNN